jgi:DNA-directed RNA polymerase specialized sigma24 family protein
MHGFRTTRWSLVLDARDSGKAGRTALNELCRLYRAPVLACVRRRGFAAADAEDLTQAFFEQFLRLRSDRMADPARGRFRVYLLGALRHFLANQAVAARAAKRGGGLLPLSLDQEGGGLSLTSLLPDPEAAFELAWADTMFALARERLRGEARAAGRSELFEALDPFLLESPQAADYDGLSQRLDMRRNTLAVALHRLRQRLRQVLRELAADTVQDDALAESEYRRVRRRLAAAGSR